MKMSEKQKLFDKAVRGMAAQDFNRSIGAFGGCRYRGPKGRRCAVGWLIPNAKYTWRMENGSASEISDECRLFDNGLTTFLTDLQEAHDEGISPKLMRKGLVQVAKTHKLKVPKALL